MKENRSSVVDNVELSNVGGSHEVKVTNVSYLSGTVTGDGHCVL